MKKALLILSLLFLTHDAWAANRYWVGGGSSANFNATGNTNWGTASNTRDNASVPGSSDDVFFDNSANGNTPCTISANANFRSINFTGWTNTLSMSTQVMQSNGGSITFVSGMTFSPTSASSINFAGTGTLTTGGLLMPTMTHSSGNMTLGDNLNFTANKTNSLILASSGTFDMNGKSINGNSVTNRILIRSTTLGTAKTITNATTSFTNADFRDITFSSASSLDLSAITGLSGDCGGNSITGGGSTLTFTTAATQTATGSSANWSTATWSGRVPLPQDDVVLSLTAGQTLTSDMPRIGKSISVTTAMTLSISGTSQTLYGSLDLTNISGITTNSSTSLTFEGRGSYTYTPNGKTLNGNFNCNQVSGTLTMMGAGSFQNLTISQSDFDGNGYNITSSNTISAGTSTWTKTITLGSGTWTNSGANGVNTWRFGSTTGLTLVTTGSTVVLSNASSSAKTFEGGSRTYNNVSFTGGGSGAVTITGSNTFNTLTIGSPKTVTFTSGTTQTVSNFVATGTAGNVITINSSSAGSAATLTKSGGGTVSCDYLSLRDNTGSPANTWYYGNNSTVVSNVNGWNSGNPPSGQAYNMLLGVG